MTAFGYDFEGRLLTVTDALNQVTSYAYDEQGSRVSQTDANGHITRFEYDKLGRQTKRTLPDGKYEIKTYNAGGEMTGRTDFLGRTTIFGYDVNSRLFQKTYPDSTGVSFTYSNTGRRLTAVDARGTTTYVYDNRDRPTSLTYPDGRMLGYAYDAAGNRTGLTATIGATTLTTTYAHDVRNQISTVTDPDGRTYTYSYSATGSPVTMAQPNGVTTTYAHDSLNRLTNLTSKHGATTLQSYQYTLGATGLRTHIDEADGTARAYGYDGLYRLTTETVTGSAADYGKTFGYDPVGNRQTQITTGAGVASVAYSYDSRDRMLTESGATYTWDDNGNLVSKSGDATYTWDFDERLVKVTKTDGTVVDHVYDTAGNRVKTTVTRPSSTAVVTNFLVDTMGGLSQVLAETDGSGVVEAYFVRAGGQLLAVRRGTTDARYYLADGLGSVRGLADMVGSTTDTRGYTAFGESLTHTGADPQPYAFAGEAFEAVSGLAYHRARWMDPRAGMFASMDPAEGDRELPTSLHNQLYAGANPVNYLDSAGRDYSISSAMASIVISANLAVTVLSARAGAVFSSGAGAQIGQFFQQLGAQAEAQAFTVLMRMKDQFNLPYLIDRGVQVGSRIIDFALRVDGSRILMELKYQIPQSGAALSRLTAQMQAALATGDEVVLVSFREIARTGQLQRALGDDFSKIRLVLGFNDLVTYLVVRTAR